jgi:hypothetical protein
MTAWWITFQFVLWHFPVRYSAFITKRFITVAVPPEISWICALIVHYSFLFSHGGGGGSGVLSGSTRHVGHWMAYCTCPGWLWWWRIRWNEDWQAKPKYSEKTYPSATLSTTNPTCQTRAWTRAAAVGSQRLTAWAMARPIIVSFSLCIQ